MPRVQAIFRNNINWPLLATLTMLIWTLLVSKYTEYGDYWASYPVVALFVIIFLLHLLLLFNERWKVVYIIYALLHIPFSFGLSILCLMWITKDSL